ncbi:MAG: hypothetical protein GY827_10280 [Cytophagales bacterium]|nr:hypothetical protein [Cytophagales bacterium]
MKYLKIVNTVSLFLIAASAFIWTVNKSFANNQPEIQGIAVDKDGSQIMTTGVGVDDIYAYFIEYKVEKDYTTDNWRINHHLYKVEKGKFEQARY